MRILRLKYIIWAVFILGLLLRIILIPLGNHGDLLSLAGWGRWINLNGTMGFYENTHWTYSWPTQLPIFSLLMAFNYIAYNQSLEAMRWLTFNVVPHLAPGHMLWWFDWVKWWEQATVPASKFLPFTDFKYGFIIWMKILPVVADLALAILIFHIGKRLQRAKLGLLISFLFLFLPFGWYLSSFWGQYDQVVALLLVGAFLLLYKRYFLFSAMLIFFAGQIKPTSGFLLPLYILYFFYQKPKIKNILLSLLSLVAIFWFTTSLFTNGNPFEYTLNVIFPHVFIADRWLLSNHAFNFWAFFVPTIESSNLPFLMLPAFVWAGFFLIIFNIWSVILLIKKNNAKQLLISFYLITAGSYLFYIGQLDRYFFPAIVALALLVFYYPKLLKWWILTCVLYSINLYYSWGFPFLPDHRNWQNLNLIRLFSFAQVATFFICLHQMGLFKIKSLNKNEA